MKTKIIFLILALFLASSDLVKAESPVLYPGPKIVAEWRDVLGSAFSHPFLTDAEVEIYRGDTAGRVSSGGGPALFRYPGITGVQVNDKPVKASRVGPDLLRVNLPAGTCDILILTRGEAGEIEALPANAEAIATPEAFQARAQQLKPGDELVVADGIYRDFQVEVKAQGAAGKPILIRPQTPGGVVIRRNSCIRISGEFIVLKGFRFEHCGPNIAVQVNANNCRVTQCQILYCGAPIRTYGGIVETGMDSRNNRVDHCYFTGSRMMSLRLCPGYYINSAEAAGRHCFDHNIFRDIYRFFDNGQECIQLRAGGPDNPDAGWGVATVEFNLFDHAWGDSEIISSKSSGNVIRHNVFAHCLKSELVIRRGHENRIEGNVMVNNATGLKVYGGKRHTIINNLFLAHPRHGILIEPGQGFEPGKLYFSTENTLIAHNTFIDCADGAIAGMVATDDRPFPPKGTTIQNNLLVGQTATLLDTSRFLESTVRRNLFWSGLRPGPSLHLPWFLESTVWRNFFWPAGRKLAGDLGEGAIVADPRLEGEGWNIHPGKGSAAIGKALPLMAVSNDFWNRSRTSGSAPDIGAVEVGAPDPAERVLLPPIPAKPVLAISLYFGEIIWAQDAQRPIDGWRVEGSAAVEKDSLALTDARAELEQDLPGDFVMKWEHQPAAFDTVARLTFAADAQGAGYVLSWGGADKDGKPSGVITLRKLGSDDVVADAPDLVQDNKAINKRATPYCFTVLKRGGRLIVLLNGKYSSQPIPVLVWEDRGVVGGPVPQGPRLRIAQRGAGNWRGFKVWKYSYNGDKEPSAPKLSAQPYGGQRVALRWQTPSDIQTDYRYDIHRGDKPGFTPSAQNLLVSRVGGGGYDDFSVTPQRSYSYAVRAQNPFGLTSEFARIEAATETGGPVYRVIPATEATISSPMRLATESLTGRRYVSAPGANYRAKPPAEGSAEFRFTVAETGTYAIWGLVLSPDDSTDSFYIALDPAHGGEYRYWSTGVYPSWTWSRALDSIALERGEHVISLKHREPTKLSALLLTTDLEFSPVGR